MRIAALLRPLWLVALLLPSTGHGEGTLAVSVIASGGGEAMGANHQVTGTLGQAIVGACGGTDFIVEGGFWVPALWVAADVESSISDLPRKYELRVATSNPSRSGVSLLLALPKAAKVSLKLYDITGREVRTLVDAECPPGYHRAALGPASLPSGVYFCCMSAGEFRASKKLLLLH
jgi:hypothetical protein